MWTLLLRLAGPLQSWGTDSRFEVRRTEFYPTKSGVLGLLAAALGRRRDADISDLARLRFGIRIEQPGILLNDFHTARKDDKTSYITNRYYLSDAVFVAGVSSTKKSFLEELQEAVKSPEYPLFLGRRSCPLSLPIDLGIVNCDLKQALEECSWQGSESLSKYNRSIILEGSGGKLTRRIMDEPLSYDIRHRKYDSRIVSEYPVPCPVEANMEENEYLQIEHDAMGELEDLNAAD
ncbi:type I-E CRISPR-associated protein Cas5/CasD [uncultured Faecalibaculum sp.]|uniref:type I-E CRISPR-associated protein Cas5/CasD n=1 Tax=uncultured Faecalibaculum sp. TaxID=1729681 RepID=UPI00272DCB5D|nr:type I-E CRISPR-associated protein Cas5/CasD [uncultured Faecalibaculum sp.]